LDLLVNTTVWKFPKKMKNQLTISWQILPFYADARH
jgi:hypothetical protein